MQSNPKNCSLLGKRSKESSYDDGSSSDTTSDIPPSRHQIKRRHSTALPNGHERSNPPQSWSGKPYLKDRTSIIEASTSEIPEGVRSIMQSFPSGVPPDAPLLRQRAPMSKAPYPQPSSTNRKVAHSNKPGKLQKKAAAYLDHVDDTVLIHARLESKRKKKTGKGPKDVPETSDSGDQPVASRTPDELTAWFEKLGLPCQPDTVKMEASHGNKQISQQKGKTFSASYFTQEILGQYGNWAFSIIDPEEGISKHSTARRAYKEKHRYNETTRTAILDVEKPPEPGTEHFCLDRDVLNHLMHERYRMLDEQAILPVLALPAEWKERAKDPEPLFYKLPQDFRNNLSLIKKLKSRKGAKKTALKPTSESDGSQTDEAPSRALPPTPRQIAAENEVANLCKKYRLSSTSKVKAKRIRDANTLNAKLIEMNMVWRKWDSRVELLRAIEKHDGVKPHIRWMPLQDIKDSAKRSCEGDVTGNEDTTSALEYPPHIITRFLGYFVNGERVRLEGTVEAHIGSLLMEVVAAKNIDVSKNGPLRFPRHFSPIGSNPSPDLFVRANELFKWPKHLKPLFPMVFAAEGKGYRALNTAHVCAQLAAPFHATLIILILYYLDTRETISSALPPWLFLYGIEYTELSISITAHYPSYVFDGETGHWELHASILTPDFHDIFVVDDVVKRFCFLAVLFRIRSHSLFVLEQLENWKRAPIVLGPLLSPLGLDIPKDEKGSKTKHR